MDVGDRPTDAAQLGDDDEGVVAGIGSEEQVCEPGAIGAAPTLRVVLEVGDGVARCRGPGVDLATLGGKLLGGGGAAEVGEHFGHTFIIQYYCACWSRRTKSAPGPEGGM